ncbi:MAG: phosphohistidine phosphatase SixA [Bdellovibrionaceae bacterium]|nr:phosphohistidine phosphatase SixA [Pseudobdellovibrionaceae bacterium]
MYLYIIRHAVAEEREDFAKKNTDDSLRPLTAKGKKKLQKMILGLEKEFEKMDVIVTSPYLRAKQSAQIIAELADGATKVVESAELVPHAPPQALVKWLKTQCGKCKKVAVVGHEPHISAFTSYLLSGSLVENFIEMKKSSVALVDVGNFEDLTPSKAKLQWLVSPRILVD